MLLIRKNVISKVINDDDDNNNNNNKKLAKYLSQNCEII
jgi:hypothetical protein